MHGLVARFWTIRRVARYDSRGNGTKIVEMLSRILRVSVTKVQQCKIESMTQRLKIGSASRNPGTNLTE